MRRPGIAAPQGVAGRGDLHSEGTLAGCAPPLASVSIAATFALLGLTLEELSLHGCWGLLGNCQSQGISALTSSSRTHPMSKAFANGMFLSDRKEDGVLLYAFPKGLYSLENYDYLRLRDITISYVHLCEGCYCQTPGLI